MLFSCYPSGGDSRTGRTRTLDGFSLGRLRLCEMASNALENTLEQLRPNDLWSFCFLLQCKKETGRLRKHLRRLYHDRDIRGIGDILVSTFSEEGALSESAEILKEIGCHGEADRLVLDAGGQSKEHVADTFKDQLIHTVRDVESILDELLTKRFIQKESYDKISALPTSQEKMWELFDGHLKIDGAEDIFYNIIKKWIPDHQGPRDFSQPGSKVKAQRGLENVKGKKRAMVTGSETSPEGDWIKLEPEVNCVDADDAPIYSLQSEAGNFECSVSGLRWVCKEKISFKYHFGSWKEHMERLKTMQYIPAGPLLDITVIAGTLEEVSLPHWICTEENPTLLGRFAVLHIDTCGDIVEQVSEVTPSHVKLSQPIFSPRGVLMRAGFPVKIKCKVLIYETKKTFLTLHVYLIPRDPALLQIIKSKELSNGYRTIQKPYPEKSLKMSDYFVLKANIDRAEICPEKLQLIYEESDPNFFEVFIENLDSAVQLTLGHESGPLWNCTIRRDDYHSTGDIQLMYELELARVRPKLVEKMSRELINQLLDDLLKDQVLNVGEKDSIIQENKTSADRARCLVDMVMKKGREASWKIMISLQSRDPTLYAELGLVSGLPV
ncbi:NACHT, LRR and PYD domains-containing protein 1b allele 2-like [Cottoperca gobio]|uniref:NACHT, LRR and PYD domains-containing protein 1b allele 2-like n=1 Tax=Cottoperca gobio TaxID=56716 RepID=A0A6J2QHN6_COTGO|nr:NACHT, LRR and PYD domains-containing protein 1b allele 2-like [Cottoperca gobio]